MGAACLRFCKHAGHTLHHRQQDVAYIIAGKILRIVRARTMHAFKQRTQAGHNQFAALAIQGAEKILAFGFVERQLIVLFELFEISRYG